ncbi:hypothetical protein AB4Y32_16660 [Paraburkholderia phymatum]|uniref:Uncharacterized protein n=1 Tax=Paraburkholderia phymatum TaxID=148447 RepID=A0ACC6U1B8_9BURK
MSSTLPILLFRSRGQASLFVCQKKHPDLNCFDDASQQASARAYRASDGRIHTRVMQLPSLSLILIEAAPR